MSDSLSYHFWNSGVVIRHNEEYEKIEGVDDGVIMHLKSGKKLKADCLLYANGRTGNTDTLALENIGLQTDSRGQLKVNSMYQTALRTSMRLAMSSAIQAWLLPLTIKDALPPRRW